jgi:hypothetical protein
MTRFLTLPAVVLTVIFGWAVVPTGAVLAQEEARTVRVSGEATVAAQPDQATVRFGIVSRAETAERARTQNAAAAKTAMNAVRELGVPEEKMRMETLRLQPRREYNPQTKEYEEKGYEATRQVVVELADLEQLPRLIARVVQRGANRLEGVEYELSDRTAVRNDALRKAAMNARDKAQLLTTSLDATLGSVRQITEEDFGYEEPQPRIRMTSAKSANAESAPEPDAYAAGEITVRARVQVVFDLGTERGQ